MGRSKEVTEYNNLAACYPDIAAQWDWDKNGALRPEKFLPGSGKKVWWKCACGHEWNTAIYHRTEGHGCKICENRRAKVVQGVNDLATKDPELAAQWDDEKNAPLTASDVTAYSQAKAWWRCEKGHSWRNTVSHRYQGEGCPYCSGNHILAGFNDIVTLGADFLDEWDYEKNSDVSPSEVGPGTVKKIWWRCSEGHSWQAPVYSRTAGNGCPFCAGNTLVPGENDLLSSAPELAAEWDYEKNSVGPDKVSRTSAKKFWWICPKGHSYRSSPGSRSRGCGCIYCCGKKVLPGFNDLKSQYPDIMEQWDWENNPGLDPAQMTHAHHEKVWWKDSLGHRWKATIANRTQGCGCPYCAGREVLKGFNDLMTLRPDIADEWDHDRNGLLRPDEVTAGSNLNVWWRCQTGHSYRSKVSSRTGKGNGCPYCVNKKVLRGFNDFATYHPELLSEWDEDRNGGKMPWDYVYGSHKKAWWICPKGHEYRQSLIDRHRGIGCPYCAGVSVLFGFNDLKTRTPWIAESWDYERNHGIRPEDVFPNSNRKFWWKCENGHRWRASAEARQIGAGCPYCYGLIPTRTHFIS